MFDGSMKIFIGLILLAYVMDLEIIYRIAAGGIIGVGIAEFFRYK